MRRVMIATLPLLTAPMVAAADPNETWQGGYNHMMWGGGYGAGGALMMLAFWGIIIALIVLAVKWFGDQQGGRGKRDALDTLRERFASGEIDEEEFRRRKKALDS